MPTSRALKKRLFPHRKALSTLVHKGAPIERKKKILIQHGGNFLGVLLPPVLRVLGSLLTSNESYQAYGSGPRIHFRKVAATTKNTNPTSNTNSNFVIEKDLSQLGGRCSREVWHE